MIKNMIKICKLKIQQGKLYITFMSDESIATMVMEITRHCWGHFYWTSCRNMSKGDASHSVNHKYVLQLNKFYSSSFAVASYTCLDTHIVVDSNTRSPAKQGLADRTAKTAVSVAI